MKIYRKKPLLALIFAVIFIVSALSLSVSAEEGLSVFVSLSNGELKAAREQVTVTDADGDGKLTVSDALYLAHETAYEGGASAGYSAETSEFGISLTKLLGVSNGGAYGYYLNNSSPSSLADEVKKGDSIDAFVYTDTENFTDIYTFFDIKSAKIKSGEELILTLYSLTYDENWNEVKAPLQGAEIIVDGKKTSIITNENGKATVYLDVAGEHIISAVSAASKIVPPVCSVSVSADSADTRDQIMTVCIVVAVVVIIVLAVVFGRKKHDR